MTRTVWSLYWRPACHSIIVKSGSSLLTLRLHPQRPYKSRRDQTAACFSHESRYVLSMAGRPALAIPNKPRARSMDDSGYGVVYSMQENNAPRPTSLILRTLSTDHCRTDRYIYRSKTFGTSGSSKTMKSYLVFEQRCVNISQRL